MGVGARSVAALRAGGVRDWGVLFPCSRVGQSRVSVGSDGGGLGGSGEWRRGEGGKKKKKLVQRAGSD